MKALKRVVAGMSAIAMLFSGGLSGSIQTIAESIGNMSTISVPNDWTNSYADWVTVNEDVEVYYKLSDIELSNDDWGEYSDPDSRLWDKDVVKLDDTSVDGRYIKFWVVQDDEVVDDYNAEHYYLDTDKPENFSVVLDSTTEPYQIKCYYVADNLSGIAGVYYSFEMFENIDDIDTNSLTSVDFDTNGFTVNCTNEMENKTLYFYTFDKAGNRRMSDDKIYVATYKDKTAPDLNVTINTQKDGWSTSIENDWNITMSKGANLYYAVYPNSDSGDYSEDVWENMPQLAWGNYDEVPEGEYYIRFWAEYADPERDIAEETLTYKYDSTPPISSSAEIIPSVGKGGKEPTFKITIDKLSDVTSGVDTSGIYCLINGERKNIKPSITTNEDETILLTFDFSRQKDLQNAILEFVIPDIAGNKYIVSVGDEEHKISYDPESPIIITTDNGVGITQSTDPNADIITPYHFGGELTDTLMNTVFVNDEYYLKVRISEENLAKIQVNIDDNKTIEFSKDGQSTDGKSWITEDNTAKDKVCFIKLSDLGLIPNKQSKISIKAFDGQNESNEVTLVEYNENNEEGSTEYTVFYDSEDDSDSTISIKSTLLPKVQGEDNYFGEEYTQNSFNIEIGDDNGIKEYSVEVNGNAIISTDLSQGEVTTGTYTTEVTTTDEDGEEVTTVVTETETYNIPIKQDSVEISYKDFLDVDIPTDGKYTITVKAFDLAGNTREESYSFIIDTTAPVIDTCEYTYDKSMIKYLSFGMFGNETYSFKITAHDISYSNEVQGIGIESVMLHWDDEEYSGTYNEKTDSYEFESLPIGHEGVAYFVITDKLGNSDTFYMVSADNNEPKVTLDKQNGNIELVLENEVPVSGITAPDSFKEEETEDTLTIYKTANDNNETEYWYPSDIEYNVYSEDKISGLSLVSVSQNNEELPQETAYNEKKFNEIKFNDKATYTYSIADEGDYNLFVYAVDNAGNTNRDNPTTEQSLTVHLDKTNPIITGFQFAIQTDPGQAAEKTTYGYFFMEDTEARVYVEDNGTSAGFNNVTLYLYNVNGEEKSSTKSASELSTDDSGRVYATFTIEKGFKGKVIAKVTDNVGHSSGRISADGNVIEDAAIHENTSSIDIQPVETERQQDANGIPLYNSNITLNVTVEDTFSGIGQVEWSIADDNKSGVITVDLDGNISSQNEVEIIERDQNLVTKIQFQIVVESNTNGNKVQVSMRDRSGNTSSYESTYSIDKTAPVITASLGSGEPINSCYYNTDKTVTISINERNFDPSAVTVKVNNADQNVSWNDQGKSVTSDDTVHTGSFTLNTDGEYSFYISYTDMAGNMGDSYSQSRFIIDKTSPKITNNFESFGDIEDEGIYYNKNQKSNAVAEISVIETNFYAADMNVTVKYMPAGHEHSDSSEDWSNYYFAADWNDDGNGKHTLSIPFEDDGVYKISMSPVDRAGNAGNFSKSPSGEYPTRTAVFETDYTPPVIVARNDKTCEPTDLTFYDLYDFDRRNDDNPTVLFEDTNIEKIECVGQKYTPKYTNGKEIGEIVPDEIESTSKKFVEDSILPQMIYTLNDFASDGVYSVKLTAYDKAGNASEIADNTYVRMVDPTVKVLAYIENSNSKTSEGWYSFEDENGPISKQPSSFSDLSIVVFSKLASADKTNVCLVDKATDESTNTNITDNNDSIFDTAMFDVGAYRYMLPGSYFEENYTADADTSLYLRVENSGEYLDFGEIYIDNTDPTCETPEHFKDWGWVSGHGNQTLTFGNVSEILDIEKTVCYVDGETVNLANMANNESSPFSYNQEENTLSLTLEPGSHKVGLLLTDRAGNSKGIDEVQHLAIGNYRVWIGIGSTVGVALLVTLIVFIIKNLKRRRA